MPGGPRERGVSDHEVRKGAVRDGLRPASVSGLKLAFLQHKEDPCRAFSGPSSSLIRRPLWRICAPRNLCRIDNSMELRQNINMANTNASNGAVDGRCDGEQ